MRLLPEDETWNKTPTDGTVPDLRTEAHRLRIIYIYSRAVGQGLERALPQVRATGVGHCPRMTGAGPLAVEEIAISHRCTPCGERIDVSAAPLTYRGG